MDSKSTKLIRNFPFSSLLVIISIALTVMALPFILIEGKNYIKSEQVYLLLASFLIIIVLEFIVFKVKTRKASK